MAGPTHCAACVRSISAADDVQRPYQLSQGGSGVLACLGMQKLSDLDLFALIREQLTTPLLGDILDREGRWHQFLPQPIKPLNPSHVVVGRAMPVRIADCTGPQAKPFGKLTEALDALMPGEIYLATGGSMRCAAWGEIMTATARARGGAGAVLDGFHRDTPKVLEQNWPVFSRGSFAQDAGVRSIVIDFRCPIEIDGALISPGDLIIGDLDGVIAIPQSMEGQVIEAALDKLAGERKVRSEIEAGSSSTAVFERYGIL